MKVAVFIAQTGRYVDADDLAMAFIYKLADIGGRAFEVALETRPEESVYDEATRGEGWTRLIFIILYVGVAELADVGLIVLASSTFVACVGVDVDHPLSLAEEDCETDAVGSIVAWPCEDDDFAARIVVGNPVAQGACGAVDELDVLYALKLCRPAVDGLDVIYREELLHCVSGILLEEEAEGLAEPAYTADLYGVGRRGHARPVRDDDLRETELCGLADSAFGPRYGAQLA